MLDLNAIKKRAEAATEGKTPAWYVDEEHHDTVRDSWTGELIAQSIPTSAAATFIANARQDVPALIAEVERLRTQQARLIAELEKADKFSDELRAELFRQQLPGIQKVVEDYVKEREEESNGR
jgi:hypothetical protein